MRHLGRIGPYQCSFDPKDATYSYVVVNEEGKMTLCSSICLSCMHDRYKTNVITKKTNITIFQHTAGFGASNQTLADLLDENGRENPFLDKRRLKIKKIYLVQPCSLKNRGCRRAEYLSEKFESDDSDNSWAEGLNCKLVDVGVQVPEPPPPWMQYQPASRGGGSRSSRSRRRERGKRRDWDTSAWEGPPSRAPRVPLFSVPPPTIYQRQQFNPTHMQQPRHNSTTTTATTQTTAVPLPWQSSISTATQTVIQSATNVASQTMVIPVPWQSTISTASQTVPEIAASPYSQKAAVPVLWHSTMNTASQTVPEKISASTFSQKMAAPVPWYSPTSTATQTAMVSSTNTTSQTLVRVTTNIASQTVSIIPPPSISIGTQRGGVLSLRPGMICTASQTLVVPCESASVSRLLTTDTESQTTTLVAPWYSNVNAESQTTTLVAPWYSNIDTASQTTTIVAPWHSNVNSATQTTAIVAPWYPNANSTALESAADATSQNHVNGTTSIASQTDVIPVSADLNNNKKLAVSDGPRIYGEWSLSWVLRTMALVGLMPVQADGAIELMGHIAQGMEKESEEFVEMFATMSVRRDENGLQLLDRLIEKQVLPVIRKCGGNREAEPTLLLLAEILRCVDCMLNTSSGMQLALTNESGSLGGLLCVLSSLLKLPFTEPCVIAMRRLVALLGRVALAQPADAGQGDMENSGAQKLMAELTRLSARYNCPHFEPLIGCLQWCAVPDEVQSLNTILRIANMLIDWSSPDDGRLLEPSLAVQIRMRVRSQLVHNGLAAYKGMIESVAAVSESVADIYEMLQRNEKDDTRHLRQLYETRCGDYNTFASCMDALSASFGLSSAEPLMTNIIQHLLFIPAEVSVRMSYCALIAKWLDEILLPENVIDTYFDSALFPEKTRVVVQRSKVAMLNLSLNNGSDYDGELRVWKYWQKMDEFRLETRMLRKHIFDSSVPIPTRTVCLLKKPSAPKESELSAEKA